LHAGGAVANRNCELETQTLKSWPPSGPPKAD
jgi:hypothetical protein